LASRLTQAPALDVSGAQDWMVIRGDPMDFVLELFDPPTMNLARVLLGLRTEDREAVVQVDGGAVRLILNRTLTKEELETVLTAFGAWHARLTSVLTAFKPREF
jgi:hypothetical protein